MTFIPCRVLELKPIEGTPYRWLRLSWSNDNAWMPVPLGHHVMLRLLDSTGTPVCRPYTPVWPKLTPDSVDHADLVKYTELSLLIKVYPNGVMSGLIDQLQEGDQLEVSLPIGQFSHSFLHNILSSTKRPFVFMLSAGSGITPMLRLLLVFLHRHSSDPGDHNAVDVSSPIVRLVCFDRTEKDQVLVDELADLESKFRDRLVILLLFFI
ncbi:unnamed protein product [Echinostoma caproni]|uniref:FAD-binding FR-type domain-containing protein n=1 Tax=Echinostoma caproni TaxID=27848 RepID=A0A183BDV5_9TREM|nr:unnamed protein product [Echinostoma caproni]